MSQKIAQGQFSVPRAYAGHVLHLRLDGIMASASSGSPRARDTSTRSAASLLRMKIRSDHRFEARRGTFVRVPKKECGGSSKEGGSRLALFVHAFRVIRTRSCGVGGAGAFNLDFQLEPIKLVSPTSDTAR
jgi:hypothetical protein